MWTRGLARWYRTRGRHDLPWRATVDPWAILVSEVMLQQTQVARVAGRWESFLARWPTPETCAAAPIAAVLREWQGLGYPRRARALHDTARAVSASGWPETEAGLRSLPGVGQYTARALRVLAFGAPTSPPQDVNIARVTARAALGLELDEIRPTTIEAELAAGWPRGMSARAFTYALFDAGALHCRARPNCQGCPLAATCASRDRLAAAPPEPRRRSPRYRGSTRELRGAVLRAMLADPRPRTIDELQERAGPPAAERSSTDIALVLDTLVHEGLVDSTPRMVRIN
ncbi:MAG TPA: A/G-specific adenine glycosylase [Candidatus Saccharimonadales bacterium]|nr:A/G-specific adenine glycosylase [Candidatus Saccharimonadales bacterium]